MNHARRGAAPRLQPTAAGAPSPALSPVEALFDAGGEIYKACAACHQRYAPQLQAPPGQAAK